MSKSIFGSNINSLCRLDGEKYKNTFIRNRKISCSDLLLMTLNKQGKTTSFEIREFLIRKKGYLILAIDGSKGEIPNTPQNREEFGCTENSSGTNVERAYDSTKNKLKIEFFTGNLPIFIYQDIYAQTLVYNQISDMVKEGNEKVAKNHILFDTFSLSCWYCPRPSACLLCLNLRF